MEWPLLLDDGTVGRSLPSGPTDAVLVIDSAGFIVSWSPGSWLLRIFTLLRKQHPWVRGTLHFLYFPCWWGLPSSPHSSRDAQ